MDTALLRKLRQLIKNDEQLARLLTVLKDNEDIINYLKGK